MFQIRLKELREKAGYSQQSFADAIGVKQSTVGKMCIRDSALALRKAQKTVNVDAVCLEL